MRVPWIIPLLLGLYLGYIYDLWVVMGLLVVFINFGNIDNKVKVKRHKVPFICINYLSICYICISNLNLTITALLYSDLAGLEASSLFRVTSPTITLCITRGF